MTRRDIIKFRRGTAAEWAASEPQPGGEVLRLGEPGWEKDTGKLKIGDGVTSWNSLPYLTEAGGGDVILQPQDVEEVMASVLTAGEGINLTWDDPSDTLTISVDPSGITGEFDKISFNTNLDDPNLNTAQLAWNRSEGTLDLGVSDTYAMHLGEELHYRVRNNTASTLVKGTSVYASGLTPGGNNRIEVAPFTADGLTREIRFMGLVTEDISNGVNGYTTHFGYIRGIDTRGDAASNGTTNKLWAAGEPAWVEGDILYAHPTVAGKLTKVEPKHSISVAIITNRHQNQGKIFVRPTSYGHLNDNHDVNTSGLLDNQFLVYDNASDYWKPSTNLTFDDTTLRIVADGTVSNLRINQFYETDDEPSRLIFRRTRGTQVSQSIANSGDGLFAVRGESIDYNGSVNILGGFRMEIVDPATPTSLNPSARIFLRTSSGGDNLLDKTCYLNADGSLVNTGLIRGLSFDQTANLPNTLHGSLTIDNGLSAPTPIYTHITSFYSGNVNVAIPYALNKQIQRFPSIPSSVTSINFVEGSGWPGSSSVDVLLEIELTNSASIIWSLVDDWYNPVPSLTAGKYLILLRSIGSTIQGHYIGKKTN